MANKNKAASALEGRKIPVEKLRRSCVNLFGVTPSTFDGASAGIQLGSRYTIEEMQAHIDKWLSTPVSLGRRKEG